MAMNQISTTAPTAAAQTKLPKLATANATPTKLPMIGKPQEEIYHLKMRIQDLEAQCAGYKARLDGLRKAKNNLIIKKTTEYVKTNEPKLGERRPSDLEIEPGEPTPPVEIPPPVDPEICKEHIRLIENLTNELAELKNLTAAITCENDELKTALETTKANFQIELARVMNKKEVAEAEVKRWETMYNEWMMKMEERVGNINRTQNLLQRVMEQPRHNPSHQDPNSEDEF